MRIALLGLGYIGTVMAARLTADGHDVVGIDPESHEVQPLAAGISPVEEPGPGGLSEAAVGSGRLRAHRDQPVRRRAARFRAVVGPRRRGPRGQAAHPTGSSPAQPALSPAITMPSAQPTSRRAPIRVLSSPGARNGSPNQTVTLLIDSLPDHVEVVGFSWARALLSRYDVLHVHWPEYLMRHRKGAKARGKRVLFALLIARTVLLRTPTVWTVHNVRPHDPGPRFERFLLSCWSRTATRRIFMYESALPSPAESRDVCIRRGDYEPEFGAFRERSRSDPVPLGRLLLFGLLRPYKGIEHLIDAARGAADEGVELLVTGGALDDAYARQLQQANDAKNVTVQIGVLSDEELAEAILSSTLVVLPYRHMYNSGAALLSLTLRRPILVPDTPTMRELRQEVGEHWVFVYDGELTTEDLRTALRSASVGRAEDPDLSRRDWAQVGQAYAALYGSIVRTGRGRPAVAGRRLARPAPA